MQVMQGHLLLEHIVQQQVVRVVQQVLVLRILALVVMVPVVI
jgi:hypothetical protein